MKRLLTSVTSVLIIFSLSGTAHTSDPQLQSAYGRYRSCSHTPLVSEKEQERFNASMIDTIAALYTHIAALPIPEILDLLEEMMGQLDEISTNYELNNQTLSWQEWAQKYWWMPPVVVVACVVLYMRYKKLSTRALV